MPINADRLKAAREAKGWSQAELASHAQVSQQTIGKLEAGTAKTSKFIARIAAALGVNVGHLDPDYETQRPEEEAQPNAPVIVPSIVGSATPMPLYASTEGSNHGGALIISSEAIEYVPRPYTLENVTEAYGILVEGESMEPAFEAGDTAWVNPVLGPRKDHDVVIYLVDEASGERRAMIKRLVSYTDTHWTLKQYNPPRTFKLERDPWRVCHRVIGKLSKR